jgi:hypothetical protein
MVDNRQFKSDLAAALKRDITAGDLDAMVSKHFPDLNVFRENQDLIIVGAGTRRLLIRGR